MPQHHPNRATGDAHFPDTAVGPTQGEDEPITTVAFPPSSRHRQDYVEWHHRWQEGLDMTAFLDEVLATEAPDASLATGST